MKKLSIALVVFVAVLFSCTGKKDPVLKLEGQTLHKGSYTLNGSQESGEVIKEIYVTTVYDSVKKKIVLKIDSAFGAVRYPWKMDSVTKKVAHDSATGFPILEYDKPQLVRLSKDSVTIISDVKTPAIPKKQ